MFTRILVPSDGSAVSRLAAEAAIDLAQACGAGIVALSIVVPDAPLLVEGGLVPDPGQHEEDLLERAHGVVDALERSALRAGVDCKPVTRIAPDASQAIVLAASDYACDLIVMGSHGRRGLSRLLAGSVTQEVLASATVPVMVFRPARPDEQTHTGAVDDLA
ncbi:universal stress protein [Telluria beijingensis]|uniref:universal stress protein n=1 Tax=Telluria beijingensis TaxID=3068633 RepID=UPI002795E94A|nr:universal stress protein [Massilia sp. REN29]